MAKKINQVTAQPSTPSDTDFVLWGQAGGSGLAYRMTFTQLKAKLDAMGGGATQLSTPGSFATTVASSSQINLSWTDVANESSYMLEWSPNGTSGWTQIGGTIAAGTTSYNHTGLTASTAYYYRLKAVGNGTTYTDSNYATTNATTSAGSSYDTDAQAYFDAQATAGYTMSTTEKDAWNAFVVAAKADSTWSEVVAAYPMNLANNFTGIKLNAKNPSDTDAARRLAVVGAASITYSGGTVDKGTGTSSTYFDTFMLATDFENPVSGQIPVGFSFYFPNNDVEAAVQDLMTETTDDIAIYSNPGNTQFYMYANSTPGAFGTPSSVQGVFSAQINNSLEYRFRRNTDTVVTVSASGGTPSNPGTKKISFLKSGRTCGFFIAYKALSNTQFDALNTKIQNYLTAVGK